MCPIIKLIYLILEHKQMMMSSIGFNKNILSLGLLIFRLFIGFAMLTHGYQKLQLLVEGHKIEFISFLGLKPEFSLALAVFSEFICSIFIILGLFTRFATIPLIINMIVAIVIVHIGHNFSKMELALFYLAGYILLLTSGPGIFSVDRMTEKNDKLG